MRSMAGTSAIRSHTAQPRHLETKVPRSPPPKSRAVTAVMRANKPKDTGPELALRRALRKRGLTGYRTGPKGIPGRPDVAFIRSRVAVFVNGCFWHQHGCARSGTGTPKSNASYWRLKFALNKARDERKIAALQAATWDTLTIWECELAKNAARCAERVQRLLTRADMSRIQPRMQDPLLRRGR